MKSSTRWLWRLAPTGVLRQDGRILVHAWDEIMVAGVEATIRDEKDRLLEVGEATWQEKDW